MFGLLLFFHLTGLSVWLGSSIAIAILLLLIKKQINSTVVGSLVQKMIKTFNLLTDPSSFIILVTGILMLVSQGITKDGGGPFWMSYMQQVGAMAIILFIIIFSVMGRKIVKRIAGANYQAATLGISTYVTGLFITIAIILSVLYVVANKFQ